MKGFQKLTKKIYETSRKSFEKVVKKYINKIIPNINKRIYKDMKSDLVTKTSNSYPKIRTGNLANNLIDLRVEKFNKKNYIKSNKSIKYSIKVSSVLDNGIGNKSYSKASVKSSKGFAYANYLNYYHPRLKGYYNKLNNTFVTKLKKYL